MKTCRECVLSGSCTLHTISAGGRAPALNGRHCMSHVAIGRGLEHLTVLGTCHLASLSCESRATRGSWTTVEGRTVCRRPRDGIDGASMARVGGTAVGSWRVHVRASGALDDGLCSASAGGRLTLRATNGSVTGLLRLPCARRRGRRGDVYSSSQQPAAGEPCHVMCCSQSAPSLLPVCPSLQPRGTNRMLHAPCSRLHAPCSGPVPVRHRYTSLPAHQPALPPEARAPTRWPGRRCERGHVGIDFT